MVHYGSGAGEGTNGTDISADTCETVATVNHKPLVVVAQAGL